MKQGNYIGYTFFGDIDTETHVSVTNRGSCWANVDTHFHVTIHASWLGQGRFAWLSSRIIPTTTTPWNGVLITSNAVKIIRSHEAQHVSNYRSYWSNTYVWYDRELTRLAGVFNQNRLPPTKYKDCDAQWNLFTAAATRDFQQRLSKYFDERTKRDNRIDDLGYQWFNNGGGWTTFMRTTGRPPREFYDPLSGLMWTWTAF